MGGPRNCGDCSIGSSSETQVGMVSCPLTDKLYPRGKEICYNPAQAAKWGAESVANILWIGEGLDEEAKKSRGIPTVEKQKLRVVGEQRV